MSVEYGLDCGQCGAGIPSRDDGFYWDGDEIMCTECRTTNLISCDAENGPYISRWTCTHGKTDDELCDTCEPEGATERCVT